MFECCQKQNLVDTLGGMICANCGTEYLRVYIDKKGKNYVYNSVGLRINLNIIKFKK